MHDVLHGATSSITKNVPLNRAIGDITPGRQQEDHAERDRKLEAARKLRQIRRLRQREE